MISVNDLKTGLTLQIDSGLWNVVEFLHVKPGKGAAFVRTKLKNVETGNTMEKTFRAGEKFPKATLEKKEMQYLYKADKDYIFMDNTTYDQITLTEDSIISFFGRKEGYMDSILYTLVIEMNPASVKDVSVKYDEVVNEDMYMTIKAVLDNETMTLTYDLEAVFDDAEKYADEELDYLWSMNNTYLTVDNEYVKSLDKNTISLEFTEENISTLGEKDTPCVTCTVRRKLANNRYTVIADVTFICEDL